MTKRIKGDSNVKTSTQLLEALIQEMEVLIKIRRENTVSKLHNPEEIGKTFCPKSQGDRRRTVGDRSFTDVDNSLVGKQYWFFPLNKIFLPVTFLHKFIYVNRYANVTN